MCYGVISVLFFKWPGRYFVRNHVLYDHQDVQHLVTRLFYRMNKPSFYLQDAHKQRYLPEQLTLKCAKNKNKHLKQQKKISRWTVSLGAYYRRKYSVVLKHTEKGFIGPLMHIMGALQTLDMIQRNEFHSVMGEIVPQYVFSAVCYDISLWKQEINIINFCCLCFWDDAAMSASPRHVKSSSHMFWCIASHVPGKNFLRNFWNRTKF